MELPTCHRCNANISPHDQFCTKCGAPAGDPDATVEVTEPEWLFPGWDQVLAQLREAVRGRFEIENELGRGGMGAVYGARDLGLGRRVAIKVMSPGTMMETGMVERFRREARTIASLKHPNVIAVHSVEHHQHLHFFVLQFVEGRSLEAILQTSGPLPISVIRAWFAQVGSALEYAHGRGVIHRDIKPANILIDTDGHAVLTDFGIAKVDDQPTQTATGIVIGTPIYMSPEQCCALSVTGASDQYSLGVVLYEMLSGTPPFSGDTLSVMRAHTDTPPRPIRSLRPDCPPKLAGALAKMLDKAPEKRWANFTELKTSLELTEPGTVGPVRDQMAALGRGELDTVPISGVPTPVTPLPDARGIPLTRWLTRQFAKPSSKYWGVATAILLVVAFLQFGTGRGTAPAPLVSLTLSPSSVSLSPHDTVVLDVALTDPAGRAVTGQGVTWASSDPTVAIVADGMLVGMGDGVATVEARAAGETATTIVTVATIREAVAAIEDLPERLMLQVGEQVTLRATVRGDRNGILSDRVIAWDSDDSRVASVSSQGRVTALRSGATRISATVDGQSAATLVTIETTVVTAVAVGGLPDSLSLDIGASRRLQARPTDSRGTILSGRPMRWQSSRGAIASVGGDGTVTALAAGSAVISVTVDGARASTAVRVIPESVASVEVSPSQLGLEVGGTDRLRATVRGSAGTILGDGSINWNSSNPSVATVSNDGTVQALGAGTVTITAATDGKTDAATVVVTAPQPIVIPLDADRARAMITETVSAFVTALDRAVRDQNMDAVRSAYGIPMALADEEHWETITGTRDFRDFEIELSTSPAAERTDETRWSADFALKESFRASRGREEITLLYRATFVRDGDGLRLIQLRMRR